MTPEARQYYRESKAEAEQVFAVRSPAMLRASLEHPSALRTLELFPGMVPDRRRAVPGELFEG